MQAGAGRLKERFWLGVNYWPRHRGLAMWRDWHPEEIDRELGEMAALGLNVARIFLVWGDFQPIREYRGGGCQGEPVARCLAHDDRLDEQACPDLVDPVMVERLAEVCALARKHGIRLIPTLLVGWMSGVSFEPPFLRDRNMFTDPTLLRYQVMLCRHLARRFRGEEAILAWDLGNEQNCFQPVPSIDAAWHWTYLLTTTLRAHDPTHAVMSGMHGLGTTRQASQYAGRFLIRDVAECTDCLCVHPYPDFVPAVIDPPLDPRATLIASWQLRLYAGVGGIPVMAQEFGTLGDGAMSREIAARYARRTLYSLLANGSIGAIWWCHTDFTVPDQMPYRTNLMEYYGLGLHDTSGEPKPTAEAFREFSGVLARLDTGRLERLPAQAAILLPWQSEHHEEAFNAFVLAKRAGFEADIVLPDQPLEAYRLLIVPVAMGHSHFTQPQWEKIRARVAAGATLYVSSGGASLPGLNEMAGLEVQYRRTVSGRREARVATERPGLEGDATLTWEAGASSSHVVCATTGTVVATGAEGAPLLVEHRWGEGVVAFLAEPVERYLCGRSGVSATDETWRLYRYLKALAGIRAPIECAHPNVEVGLLREGENRVVVLVNHSDSPVEAVLTVDPSVAGLADLDGRPAAVAAGTCTVELPANGGAVLRAAGA
ncbi:MAG: cellulase family glycosylhydrolase [Armatimonadetes bacterium]|nr:cellulase family glycosylhydrolase [Armatimonadota bacterium]